MLKTLPSASARLLYAVVLIAVPACYNIAARGGATTAAGMTEQDERLVAAAVDTIAVQWHDTTSAVCVAIMTGAPGVEMPDERLLRRLATARQVVPADHCPKTYTSMFQLVDSLGRPIEAAAPAGYVDPHILTIGRPQYDRPGYGRVHIRETQGTEGRVYLCTVQQYDGPASASCRRVDAWIS